MSIPEIIDYMKVTSKAWKMTGLKPQADMIDDFVKELEVLLSKDTEILFNGYKFKVQKCEFCVDGIAEETINGRKEIFPCGNCMGNGAYLKRITL